MTQDEKLNQIAECLKCQADLIGELARTTGKVGTLIAEMSETMTGVANLLQDYVEDDGGAIERLIGEVGGR